MALNGLLCTDVLLRTMLRTTHTHSIILQNEVMKCAMHVSVQHLIQPSNAFLHRG